MKQFIEKIRDKQNLSFEESNTRFAELHPSAKKDYRDWLKAESD